MQTQIPLLQNVRVASPCDASWEGMEAVDGERVKFCLHCAKNVYNLSEMSQGEAEGLLRKHEGKLCVRYYQRRDGTVLTRDCPIGAQAVRMALIRRSTVAASLFAMLFGAMAATTLSESRLQGRVVSALTPVPVVGDVSVTPPVPTPPVVPEPHIMMQGLFAPIHTMGKPVLAPPPPAHVRMGRIKRHEPPIQGSIGHIPRPEQDTDVIAPIPDKPYEFDYAPAKDNTDEAILKPRKEE